MFPVLAGEDLLPVPEEIEELSDVDHNHAAPGFEIPPGTDPGMLMHGADPVMAMGWGPAVWRTHFAAKRSLKRDFFTRERNYVVISDSNWVL